VHIDHSDQSLSSQSREGAVWLHPLVSSIVPLQGNPVREAGSSTLRLRVLCVI
jgi:hypothetical protein